MSPLLAIEGVSKAFPDGRERLVVLDHVSFDVPTGGQVGLYGPARSGKSTLLRIAVGIEPPDCGSVYFEGRNLMRMRAGARARLLRRSIGYISLGDWRPGPAETVVDHVATALGSDGYTPMEARRKALRSLELVQLPSIRRRVTICSLSAADRARVALARALVREPRLLVVDEPTMMPSLRDRDRYCALLRDLARKRNVALLAASAEWEAVQGMDVLMTISAGELVSSDEPASRATVVRLPTRPGFGPTPPGPISTRPGSTSTRPGPTRPAPSR